MATKRKQQKSIYTKTEIAKNKRGYYDYIIEYRLESAIILKGWEMKSIRAGHVQLTNSYVHIRYNEAWLLNAIINPLDSASTHFVTTPDATRKLLLHRREIIKLSAKINRDGYTIIPLIMYWKGSRVKLEIAVAKGKKLHDKRESLRKKEWKHKQNLLLKSTVRYPK